MHAIILAAGEGIRLRPLTTYMPKVMVPVGNKPIMEYIIESLRAKDIHDITIVVGYMEDKIKQYFGSGKNFGVNISYVTQKKQLGTAHALSLAKIDDEFLLFYGDNMIDEKCVEELMSVDNNTILGAYTNKPSRYGLIIGKNGEILEIKEKPKNVEGGLVFTGMGRFSPDLFDYLEEKMEEEKYTLPEVLNDMKLKYKVTDCGWKDAVYPWDLLDLNMYSLRKIVRKISGKIENSTIIGNVEIGDNTVIGSGTYIHGNVKIGKNCRIGPNSVILGNTSIGNGVEIGALSYVENSMIMDNTFIGENSLLKDSVIGREANIGAKFTTISGEAMKIINGETIEVEGGAIVGDGAIIGSMVILHPGTIIGANAKVDDLKSLKTDVANFESVR